MLHDDILLALEHIAAETKYAVINNACQRVKALLQKDSSNIAVIIKTLSYFILKTEHASLFRKYLSNFLLALVSEKIPLKRLSIDPKSKNYDSEALLHLKFSITLAVLSDHPDILQYILKYFDINQIPPYEVYIQPGENYEVVQKKPRLCRQEITDHQIVLCCYTLLSKLPNKLSTKWDWSTFVSNFAFNENVEIRWMVKECLTILCNMTEKQSKQLCQNLNITEQDVANITVSKKDEIQSIIQTGGDVQSKDVVYIDGILLLVYDKENIQNGSLVSVKSTTNNLRSLALSVASGKALCLMGPVGSGKTSLVEHLAAITGRKGKAFKKVQLGDQTDSRMLLGSHQCTDIPGEFVWQPGILTEAAQNGHWLLLEDIDCAALDVASTLSSLLERNTLCVPGYRDALPVRPGFQLFVTQRTLVTNYGFQKKLSNSSTLLQKHLTQINVEPLSRAELGEIIKIQYPSLSTICSRMLDVYMMFSVGSHDTSLQTTEVTKESNTTLMKGSRLISTRDLLKWCSRSVVGFDVASPESALKVLQDALDIFTCSVQSPEDRLKLAKKVATFLGIVETKSEFFCKHYKPNVSLQPNVLEAGRAKVQRKEKSLESIEFGNKQVVFSFTRQSACLLERLACCVTSNEPVLLVGETGTGKTSSVQYLAKQTGHKLVVINMNQQSDSADLLGGYKPVDLKYIIKPIKNQFEDLFRHYFNVEKNNKFLGHIQTCFDSENWTALAALMKQSHKAAVKRLVCEKMEKKLQMWLSFGHKLSKLEQQIKSASRLTFAFIEGSLVKAMQEGHWVLLDEINLASAEILECLAGLLEDKDETIDLIEKGDKMPIKRHPDFTLFACMNPATDVGKKDLPTGLRNRFTEFFIDELTERNDLILLIGDYLCHMNLDGAILESIYNFYTTVKKESKLSLVDGAGNAPHYSLRTLCRALTAAAKAKCGTVSRSLYEAFCLSFLTQLDSSSHPKVEAMVAKAVIGKKNIKSVLNQSIPEPQMPGQSYLLFEGHWIPQGKLDIYIPHDYILTATVKKNLRDIARIISLGRLPVLLQGDTSVGKTSLITYIAKASGNYCVRINNHEHTDLQEYIGSYATDAGGKLVFKEGVLVEAMRKGYWIILDELNLAPSDVLEALNRVLDDNRELFIPETQQVVKADPNFMLFATQNPPGLYGGRKMLSRAFRNRFVELHFDLIPRNELEIILHQRCYVPATYSKKMIAVMTELQVRRRGSAAVQGKDGFITLRDLFRWGQRYKHASKETLTENKFYDWDQHIADEGYLILAGKVRQTDEIFIIEEVIEKHIKRKVSTENLFSLHQTTSPVTKSILEMLLNNQLEQFSHIVWTYNMRRLAVLIAKAFYFNEPVLLVGETGCGKTTICQVLATLRNSELFSVNCHMHTESSDFLGGLRPVRQHTDDGRLFEWVDGPLVMSMLNGQMFLADEISLADDSVLERLNSLLEPERQLVLSERSMEDNSDILIITAEKNFHFIGTMNPGGDFGKKELSPALRNRFTEIWCDSITSRDDLLNVLEKSVNKELSIGRQEDGSSGIGNSILDFTDWLKHSEVTNKFPFSIRDLLSWVHFINTTVAKGLLNTPEAYVHGACMTFLDCFGTTLTGHIESETLTFLRERAIQFLLNQIKVQDSEYTQGLKEMLSYKQTQFTAECDSKKFGIKPFYIDIGPSIDITDEEQKFTFTAPTTGSNTLRLLRGLQLNKAILLEGNPGVGKTSLVTALAKSSGHKVVRINLSDQTDITDLFGTDLPTEDGFFTFKEGAFLNALQNGDWILLDELNLAPQPVLEGLNACLDHRGEVYIPELGKTFKVKKETKLFACQNPLKQGGARRGLPISFLNRFTQVYIDTLTKHDLIYIVEAQFPSIEKDILYRIVEFNCRVAHEVTERQSWAHRGAPWEMNLRDVQRWCEAIIKDKNEGKTLSPGKFVDMLYVNRMRTLEDKERMIQVYNEIFCPVYPRSDTTPQFYITENNIFIGDVVLERNIEKNFRNRRAFDTNLLVLRNQLPALKALAQSVKMNWLSIIVGPAATGKSSIVQVLSDLTGNDLQVVPVTSAMDVSDLLGGFEQMDYNRTLENICDKIETLTMQTVRKLWLIQRNELRKSNELLSQLHKYKCLHSTLVNNDSSDEVKNFCDKITFLDKYCKNLLKYTIAYGDIKTKVQEIVTNLEKLQTKVLTASSVNVGGKFEWIDSLLVKTMTEGSWLQLDNVNLTSAAVLDRLNGLLEPNGVLSIPERGEISEIRPHPNFRIFFTMDPKYGEISRAMRNRGVEIFLLGHDHTASLSETLPYMDLEALLSSCGLPNRFHDLCIKCHELMSSFIQGLERPSVSHLLQAAYLTWQQINRGIPYKVAVLNSFSDVYIKPRCGGDFTSNVNMSLAEMKNSMLKALENELQKDYKIVLRDSSHTLTVKGLCKDSMYEVAKQDSYVAIQQPCCTERDLDNLKALHSLFSIFTTYQKCTRSEEVTLMFYNVIKAGLEGKNDAITVLASQLNEAVYHYFNNLPNKNVCKTHKRFNTEMHNEDAKLVALSNTKSILLYNKLWNTFLENTLTGKHFTVLLYSKAVCDTRMNDWFEQYPILRKAQQYITTINEYIEKALFSSAQHSMNDSNACHILQLLNWRNRFVKLCHEPIYKSKKTSILREEIVPLLYMHSRWLQKYLIEKLLEIFLPEKHILWDKVKAITESLMPLENQENRALVKLGKQLRKLSGQPKLYKNQIEYNQCLSRSDIYKKNTLDLHQPIEKQFYKFSTDVANVSDSNLALDVPQSDTVNEIKKNVAKIIQNANEKRYNQHEVELKIKMLPLNSYILHRILSILHRDLYKKCVQLAIGKVNDEFRNEFAHLITYTVQIGKVTGGFPVALINMLEVIKQLQDGAYETLCQRISSIPSKFWDEFYKYLVYTPACYPLPFLRITNRCETDETATVPADSKRLSTNIPLSLYYIQKMTVSEENEGPCHVLSCDTVSLEDNVQYSIQLGSVLNVLWNNIATLDSTALMLTISNAEVAKNKYIQTMRYLLVAKQNKNADEIHSIDYSNITVLCEHFKDQGDDLLNLIKEGAIQFSNLCNIISQKQFQEGVIKVVTCLLSFVTNMILTKALTEVSSVDHVEKYRLKIQYIEEDVRMFDALLSAYYMHGLVSGTITSERNIENSSEVSADCFKSGSKDSESLKKVHPHCSILMELKEKTMESVHKYASGNTFRPETPSFQSFEKECRHFRASVLSWDMINKLTSNFFNLEHFIHNFNESIIGEIDDAKTTIHEVTTWLQSVNAFQKKVDDTYSEAFPDLAKPLQSSLSQIVHDLVSLCDLTKEHIAEVGQDPQLSNIVEDLMEYPNTIPNREDKEEYLNRFATTNFVKLLNRNTTVSTDDIFNIEIEFIQILKMNLSELKMHCIAMERVDKATFKYVLQTLQGVARCWEKQRTMNEKKQQEDEALYVTQSKCQDPDDEVEMYKEILEMFPTFSDSDFGEFKPPSLEQRSTKLRIDTKKSTQIITPQDITYIYKLFSSFIRNIAVAEWLPKSKKLVSNDVVSPFLQRYTIFSRVVQNSWEALQANTEGVIYPGMLVILSHIKDRIDGQDVPSDEIDFYHTPWVSETRQCAPLLRRVRESTNALLEQWPDFPTLKEIVIIVDRILSFPVTSPVSRFLTGLELLRDKIEEWNKNAHKGNNMIDISLDVGQQIVNWRKLEMNHWKECLNNVYYKKQSDAHKFWFSLHRVANEYLDEAKVDETTAAQIIVTLKSFMETSSFAEYAVRLDIIYIYHLQLIYLEPSHRRDELLSILWNTYNYYNQFSIQIATQIKEKRAPIEKKLRDFVKICTWDRDLSYWSVKDTVEKAHKALHKHTKEFENILKETVTSYLIDNSSESGVDHVGLWDRPKRANTNSPAGGAYLIDLQNFLVLGRNIKKYLDQIEKPTNVTEEGSLLSKATTLFNKAKKLCKDTMLNTSYPSLVQSLDDFVTIVIESSSHLGSLEVDSTKTKEEQTSQAKNIIQQKRKALADLFKHLNKMGLNYRTGLVILSASSDDLYDFTTPPVELDATMSYMKNRRCDGSLSLLWSGCEKYFQRNIARHRQLSATLLAPHKDMGMQNIERCKGFTAHLLKITNSQKKIISKYSRHLCDLRTLTTNLTNALDIDTNENISMLKEKADILRHCYIHTGIMLEQFIVVLKSCPEKGLCPEIELEFDKVLSNSPIVRCYKNSEEWHDLFRRIKAILSTVNKQKLLLNKLHDTAPKEITKNHEDLSSISQSHLEVWSDAFSILHSIKHDIDTIFQEYQFQLKFSIENFAPKHPMLNCIINLSSYLEQTILQLDVLDESQDIMMEEEDKIHPSVVINKTEDLIATMLLIIQTIYKKHVPQSKGNTDVLNVNDESIDVSEKEESKETLEDNHLKERLQEKLSGDIKMLQLETLIIKMHNLLQNYVEFIVNDVNVDDVKNVVMRLVPILEQTVLFVQYFVTEQVAAHRVSCKMLSVLLRIFSELAAKGFCRPSDLDTEEGDGDGGPGKLSSGTGLGDGEGQKDVSERIENQDQLDDARRPGDEKKEEDRDCKEEEKGINVTDDFDSHLQDLEKKEGDDKEQEEDEDDADKQMGETDNAAEKLDQQIWGSEDEELEDENEKKEKEDKGKGESTGEREMTAKQEEQAADDGAEEKERKQKRDINEMDEPEIDDDHVDPYHGNQQQLPEPEDFDLPEDMNVDGEEPRDEDDKTETENPFEIDVMKDNIPEQKNNEDEEQNDKKDDVTVISSDSEDEDEGNDGNEQKENDTNQPAETNETKEEEEDKDAPDEDANKSDENPEDTPETDPEHTEETPEKEELPKNSDNINEEDDVSEKNHDPNPQANPSNNDPSAEEKAEKAEGNKGTGDNVETNAEQTKDEEAAPHEQSQEQVGEDKQSSGRSELDKSDKGHRGDKQATATEKAGQHQRRENKPGRTEQERTLADVTEQKHKKSRTLNVEKEQDTADDGGDADDDAPKEADAYQHVKQAKQDDLQALDAATKEQAEQQPTLQQDDEDGEQLKEDEEVPMEVDDDDIQVEKSEELKSEKFKDGTEKEKEKAGNKKDGGEEPTGEAGVEVEGEKILTAVVQRPSDTTYHTRLEAAQQAEQLSVEEYMSIRSWLNSGSINTGTSLVWRSLWQESATAARALCERLRLVLEPTGRSRRAGDFRTGRAINMRRVIPYIASHFRKDRIWLRRTKPAKREYKIAIAIDDSSSMADNRSKELAFESLALVSQALNLLESGDLAVVSFGEKPNLLHPFTEQFTEHSGSKILEQLRFEQSKTKIAQLLDFCTVLFDEQTMKTDALNAKLLVVVSDGRGIFSEGETRVIQAVRRARQQGIFLVYMIIDNPDNKDSIMDIRRPIMDPASNTCRFIPYLDAFPFPFYLILRDMSALPNVLGDALRQWFELAANTAN